jgi:hypothetical protein
VAPWADLDMVAKEKTFVLTVNRIPLSHPHYLQRPVTPQAHILYGVQTPAAKEMAFTLFRLFGTQMTANVPHNNEKLVLLGTSKARVGIE